MQNVNESFSNVQFNLQQQIVEVAEKGRKAFPKSCYNCKHKRYGYHNVSDGPCDRWGGLDSYDYAGICIRSGHTFWEPGVNINIKYSNTKTSVSAELLQCNTNEETLEVARKHGLVIDLTKQEEPDQKSKTTTFIDLRADLDNTPLMDIGIRKVYETEHSRTVVIENKPEKKYTVYDMYDLVFPDDPIKAHFDAERKRINEEYEKQKAVVDKLEVPEVKTHYIETIPTETIDDDPVLSTIAIVILVALSFALIFAFCELAYFDFSLV